MEEYITVFGSFVVDLMARASHLPVEGETVKANYFKMGPGGKGFNQGIAASKAGAKTFIVTKLGEDEFANVALDTMKELKMDTDYVFRTSKIHTGTALIMVDENTSNNKIMVTSGACGEIDDSDISKIEELIKNSKFLLTQLETNLDAVYKVIEIANKYNVPIILDPAPAAEVSKEILAKLFIFTPNEVEAEFYTGIKLDCKENIEKAALKLRSYGVKNIVITLGSRGVYVYSDDKGKFIDSYKVDAVDTTGAGDAFSGGLVAALAENKDLDEAVKFANAVAAISVTSIGTTPAMPKREEVNKFLEEHNEN